MYIDLSDRSLFGNDAGEDEDPKVLASYFVDNPAFGVFWEQDERLQIARARKGMGKSALLAKLGYDLRQNSDLIVLSLTGSDLTGMGEFASEDPAILVNQWQQVLCSRINVELSRLIKWASKDSNVMMVESSELAGFRGQNLVGVLLNRIRGRIGNSEFQKLETGDHAALIQRYLYPATSPTVWLLIDDVDSTFMSTPHFKNKLSAFFSACRRLVQLVDGLRIRASVRADVWTALLDNEDLDKCEQYMTDIRWTKNEVGDILSKKILAHVQRNHSRSMIASWDYKERQEQLIELVFEHRLPWGDMSAPPLQIINIFAAKRPRWLAQLCRLSGAEAARLKTPKIGIQAINSVLSKFGKLRISDLYKEHAHQFTDVKKLIEAFARGPRRYTTNELLNRIFKYYISRVGASTVPEMEGAPKTDALICAHFLFKIGFLQGRSDEHGSLSHVDYDDRPTLLTTGVNFDDGMLWEVYPSYRNVLNIHHARLP